MGKTVHYNTSTGAAVPGCLGALVFILAGVAAWVTHVAWAVSTLASDTPATGGQMLLAILGTVAPPLGAIHGVILWFN